MSVFFVAEGFAGGEVCEDIPGRVFGEELFLRGVLSSDFCHGALRSAADFQQDAGGCFGIEWPRRIVVGEGQQEALDLFALGRERVPPIAVAVVDDRAGAQDLLDAGGVFAGDADDHVDEFVELEGLFDDGADADEAGVFFGVAEGDLVGEWHGEWDYGDRPEGRPLHFGEAFADAVA